jgi:hypothetical protein
MPSYEERVAGLLADARITKEQARELLEARDVEHRGKWWDWVLNPMSRLPSVAVLLISMACVSLGAVVSRAGIRFDGALDVHIVATHVTWATALADALVSWPLPALVFWAVARSFKSRARYVDCLAAVGLGRPVALVIGAAGVLLADPSAMARVEPGKIGLKLVLLALISLPLVVWMVALMVFGFREASGMRGMRLAVASVIAIVVAEVTSKIALAMT